MIPVLMHNFYFYVLLFTIFYSLAYILFLSSRFSYSRTSKRFAIFLVCVVLWAVKDALGEVLLPQFTDATKFRRILIWLSPLYLLLPYFTFNMLISVYNAAAPVSLYFKHIRQVNTALIIGCSVIFAGGLFFNDFFYTNLTLHRSPYDYYSYTAGIGMLLFAIITMITAGIPAVALLFISRNNVKSESFFLGLGTLLSVSVSLVSNVLPGHLEITSMPRLGCLSMFIFCNLTFYAIIKYGKLFSVPKVLEEHSKSRLIVNSLKNLIDIKNEDEIFQKICDDTCEISNSLFVSLIAFTEEKQAFRVRNLSAQSPSAQSMLTSLFPIVPGKKHPLSEAKGLELQQKQKTPAIFNSIAEFFGKTKEESRVTDRYFYFDVRQIISYPIVFEKNVWGALVLFMEREIKDSDMYNMFSIQCSLVLKFSAQIQELEKLRSLEDELHQAQKMEAIGQLAGGIAHDFNNMLSGISGYAQLIKKRFVPKVPELKIYADSMLSASKSASELTDKLLAFARKGKYQTVAIDMHETINAVIEILSRTIDRRIDIKREFIIDDAIIIGDPTQMQNLVLNLALNARNAMPKGGDLIFRTEEKLETKNRTINGQYMVKAGKYLSLSVIDTGTGMEEKVKKRIFEPFFTTQQSGKGTGLGLSSVYGTVKNHDGFIQVFSEPGKGSTFQIFLPFEEEKQEVVKKQHHTQELTRGTGHIMVVDDEEIVRTISKEILAFLGYKVTCCNDGPEAIAYLKKHKDTVSLVLLDVMMRQMDGYETFKELKNIKEDLKVIIMTGYSLDEDTHRTMIKGVNGFIKKPFDSGELSRMISDVIKNKKQLTTPV